MDKSLRILVVDDERDILETLDYSLALRGFEVTTAEDGLEALEKAKRVKPDVMLLDVMLPGCNGYEVSRLLKEWMETTRTRGPSPSSCSPPARSTRPSARSSSPPGRAPTPPCTSPSTSTR